MFSLQPQYITDIYVLVDDLVEKKLKPKGGRPEILSNSELITILIWNALTTKQKTIKDVFNWVVLYHKKDFPKLPKYKGFVYQCHRVIRLLAIVLEKILLNKTAIRIMDSTMIPVCKIQRADNHNVAKNIADFGKNHQGWHYGFKLHASIDSRGRFCGLNLTPASQYDAQEMPKILNKHARVAVGDGTYNASVMREKIFKQYGTFVVAPPHPKQNKKLINWWQYLLLKARPKIESVFDYLKEHMGLVTSFPRSVNGYLFHYLRILVGYQFRVL